GSTADRPGSAAREVRTGMAGGLARRRPSQPACLCRPRPSARGDRRALRLRLAVSHRTAGFQPTSPPSVKEPPLLDIVVSGGLAVLPSGPEPADIGIAGWQTAAIAGP